MSINYQLAGKDANGTSVQHGECDPVTVSVKPVTQASDMVIAVSGMDDNSVELLPAASGSAVIQDGRVIGMVVAAARAPIDAGESAIYGVSGNVYDDGLIDSDVIKIVLESKEIER